MRKEWEQYFERLDIVVVELEADVFEKLEERSNYTYYPGEKKSPIFLNFFPDVTILGVKEKMFHP